MMLTIINVPGGCGPVVMRGVLQTMHGRFSGETLQNLSDGSRRLCILGMVVRDRLFGRLVGLFRFLFCKGDS